MEDDSYLFDIEPHTNEVPEKGYSHLKTPLWTRNKAHFIARYLKSFIYITHHGTYIDAFAGPQHEESRDESWAAKLVMQNEPKWLRKFHLFDIDPDQIAHLKDLENQCPDDKTGSAKRTITISEGDCNVTLPRFLSEKPISEKEATFCLLDQRSTECSWNTVTSVANYKGQNGGRKIEIFYFLPQGWMNRTIKSWKIDVEQRCKKWWGRDDVMDFLRLRSQERGFEMANRFKKELGYKYAFPFPVQKEGKKGATMFWMIHASDHERAPRLMTQAYNHIGAGGGVGDPIKQMELDY